MSGDSRVLATVAYHYGELAGALVELYWAGRASREDIRRWVSDVELLEDIENRLDEL